MIVSELGIMIKVILENNLKEEIEQIKQKYGIKSQTLVFHEIYYRHVDVMGSGRFFYAEKKENETNVLL